MIYTQTLALLKASVKYIIQSSDRFIIFSDPISALPSLKNIANPADIARNLQNF
jgi:hypothetical protein